MADSTRVSESEAYQDALTDPALRFTRTSQEDQALLHDLEARFGSPRPVAPGTPGWMPRPPSPKEEGRTPSSTPGTPRSLSSVKGQVLARLSSVKAQVLAHFSRARQTSTPRVHSPVLAGATPEVSPRQFSPLATAPSPARSSLARNLSDVFNLDHGESNARGDASEDIFEVRPEFSAITAASSNTGTRARAGAVGDGGGGVFRPVLRGRGRGGFSYTGGFPSFGRGKVGIFTGGRGTAISSGAASTTAVRPSGADHFERNPGKLRSVIAKFQAFLQQVPDAHREQRCKALLSAFSGSQRSPYVMWINSNHLFMRVRVVDFVDIRSEFPRMQVHIREREYASVALDEVFCDCKEIQYKTFAEAQAMDIPFPSLLADELPNYMQIVDNQRHDELEESGPATHQDADVRQFRDPLADGGRYEGDATRATRFEDDRPRRFDPKQIKMYHGRNVYTDDPAKYEEQPTTWLRQMHTVLTNQGINRRFWVTESLKCVDPFIQEKYQREVMQPDSSPGNWEMWDQRRPPQAGSLDFGEFAKWLCHTFLSSTHTVATLEEMHSQITQGHDPVDVYNFKFIRLTEELHQQRCLMDNDYGAMSGENGGDLFPPMREDRRLRNRYMEGLNTPIAEELRRLNLGQNLQGYINGGIGNLTRVTSDIGPATVSQAWMTQQRSFKNGANELRLRQLMDCAILIESTLKDMALTRARATHDRPARFERKMLSSPSGNSFLQRQRSPPAAAPLRALRVNALDAQVDEVEEIDEEETQIERLYSTMLKEKKVQWTRAQLKKLMKEDRCFNCAKKDHRAPECKNPPANPRTVRFTNLLEITSFDEEDASLFHALRELNDLEEESGNGMASH